MFKLNYKKLDGTHCEMEFKKSKEMIDFIDKSCIHRRDEHVVWLLAREGTSDMFVSKSHVSIQDFIENKSCWNTKGVYFLREHSSFHEAYIEASFASTDCADPKDAQKNAKKSLVKNMHQKGMSLREIETATGISKSTAHRILTK